LTGCSRSCDRGPAVWSFCATTGWVIGSLFLARGWDERQQRPKSRPGRGRGSGYSLNPSRTPLARGVGGVVVRLWSLVVVVVVVVVVVQVCCRGCDWFGLVSLSLGGGFPNGRSVGHARVRTEGGVAVGWSGFVCRYGIGTVCTWLALGQVRCWCLVFFGTPTWR